MMRVALTVVVLACCLSTGNANGVCGETNPAWFNWDTAKGTRTVILSEAKNLLRERFRLSCRGFFASLRMTAKCYPDLNDATNPAAGAPSTAVAQEKEDQIDTEHVVRCSEVRDRVLLTHKWGVWLVDFYYRYSPFAFAATNTPESEGSAPWLWLRDVGTRSIVFLLRNPILLWLYFALVFFFIVALVGKLLRRIACGRAVASACERAQTTAAGQRLPRAFRLAVVAIWVLLTFGIGAYLFAAGKTLLGSDNPAPPESLATAGRLSPETVRGYARIRNMTAEDLAACLRSPDEDVRYEAAYAAAKSPALAYESGLIFALKDPDLRVRRWAATGLATLRSRLAFDQLLILLKDPQAMVRYKAALALGKAGDRRAVPQLRERLSDKTEHMWVRVSALQALERILGRPK